MSERRLDRLFLRYRRKGDPAALGEVFDRAAPELLKLSMHLVRDPVEAEDVLQATFLAAIEGADSFDASRPLMPWLTGILARQAGLVRRRARRAIEADRLPQRESVDPAQAAALREFSEELVIALQELPDNYREVLWLHLADGKRPVEIAQDLNRAPGTVRMQVHRGLELLRRALPAGYAATAGILGATRGLAAIRVEVLSQGATRWHPMTPIQGAPATPGAIGAGSAIAKFSLAILALATIVATAWWQMTRAETNVATLAGVEAAVPAEPEAARALESSVPDLARSAQVRENTLAAEPAAADASPIFLRGRVLGCRSDEYAEVQLTVHGIARFMLPEELVLRRNPAADGSFEFDVTRLFGAAKPKRPLEELVIEADHPRHAREMLHIPLEGPIEHAYTAELQLSPACLLSGRVLTPRNEPAVAAIVALYALVNGAPLEPPVDRVPCAIDGTFALRARESGEHAVLVFSDDLHPATLVASLTKGLDLALGTIVQGEGAAIEGQAWHLGQPMRAGALVSAAGPPGRAPYALEGSRLSWADGRFERAGRIVETDAEGRFRISGLAPGPYRVGVVRAAPEGAQQSQRRLLSASATWALVQAPASRMEIQAAFATVHLRLTAPEVAGPSPLEPAQVHWGQANAATQFPLEFGALGSVSVEPLIPCAVRIRAQGFLGQDFVFDAPGPGEESTQVVSLRRDLALAQLSVEIRTSPAGPDSPIREAAFEFSPQADSSSTSGRFVRHASSTTGVFEIANLPAGRWWVSVYAGGVYEHYLDLWCGARLGVQLSPASVANVVVTLERGGHLQLCAVNRVGSFVPAECSVSPLGSEPQEVQFVGRGPRGRVASSRFLSALGSCDVHPILRAGRYEIALSAKGHAPARIEVEIGPGKYARIRAVLEELESNR